MYFDVLSPDHTRPARDDRLGFGRKLPERGIVPPASLDLSRYAILLDIDGTILDIAPTPHEVQVPDGLRRALTRLIDRTGGALAVVSGREIDDIDKVFAPLRLAAVGGHGAEIRVSPAMPDYERRGRFLEPDLRRKLCEIGSHNPGVIVEDKGFSIAIHYRLAMEKELPLKDAVYTACALYPRAPIEILPGKAVIEIKTRGVNKGTGVRELMMHPPFAGRCPLFIGDDTTDEDAFAVLPDFNGMGISVGRVVPGTAGKFQAPHDVRQWLEQISRTEAIIAS
jgi:trehalose 6-phosphate phosphatase